MHIPFFYTLLMVLSNVWFWSLAADGQVQRLNELAKAKVELAKALLRAAEKAKPKKTGTSTKEDEGKSPTKKRKTA